MGQLNQLCLTGLPALSARNFCFGPSVLWGFPNHCSDWPLEHNNIIGSPDASVALLHMFLGTSLTKSQ